MEGTQFDEVSHLEVGESRAQGEVSDGEWGRKVPILCRLFGVQLQVVSLEADLALQPVGDEHVALVVEVDKAEGTGVGPDEGDRSMYDKGEGVNFEIDIGLENLTQEPILGDPCVSSTDP